MAATSLLLPKAQSRDILITLLVFLRIFPSRATAMDHAGPVAGDAVYAASGG